jgi:uncharacterized protein involved in exopolysaccharide biosynthesis
VYRKAHTGELPSQLDSNLQAIQNTQMQIQSVVESLNRDRDRRLVLERQLTDAEEPLPTASAPAPAVPVTDGENISQGTATKQLEFARNQLKALELRLKPEHPDIGLLKRRIRDLEKAAEAEALAVPVTPGPSRAEIARQQRIDSLRTEMEQLDRLIVQKTDEEERLRGISSSYQSRVDAAPTRETELVELTRDYMGLQNMYASLQQKKEDSKLAASSSSFWIQRGFRRGRSNRIVRCTTWAVSSPASESASDWWRCSSIAIGASVLTRT